MKPLICEMCGGNDLIKKDDLIICQNCGIKYSFNDFKNKMNNEVNTDFEIVAGVLKKYKGQSDTVIIPDSVKAIEEKCFKGSAVKKVIIPNSVINIGNNAFELCQNLETITIGNSVISIGKAAFSYCSSLKNIDLPDSITYLDEYTFYNCNSLNKVKISNSIKIIGDWSFYKCCNIKEIILPNTLTNIGKFAFSNCLSLESINIPDSVINIGEYAFSDCSMLKEVKIGKGIKFFHNPFANTPWIKEKAIVNPVVVVNGLIVDTTECEGDIIIPNSVKIIDDYAFSNCYKLTSIVIPNSISSIGNYAFQNCINLQSVTMSDQVLSIGNQAFYNCEKLGYIKMSKSLKTIGNYAFGKCNFLKPLKINYKLLDISKKLDWFNGSTKYLKNRCENCGGKIYSFIGIYAKCSICGKEIECGHQYFD